MKKILVFVAVAFAVVAGTAAVVTVHPQAAMADRGCGGSVC
jgi:hypothetical protein